MIRKTKEDFEWLEFELLQEFPRVTHGVFLKPTDFKESGSQQQIKGLLGLESMVRSHLVHGREVHWVTKAEILTCDGLVTKTPDLGLVVTHADCQAAVFYDPVEQVIANVHCGWRGNVQNIYALTVAALKEAGSKPENLLVGISPSLGPEHAEFIQFKEELPTSFWGYQTKPFFFDFWAIARDQLIDCGVLPDHIEVARMCTYADESQFFSYRRNKKTGRHATVMAIRR